MDFMFLKFTLKRAIKNFLAQSGMDEVKINYILNKNIDFYAASIPRMRKMNNASGNKPSKISSLQYMLVGTANKYMVDLLDIEQGMIQCDEDIIKLHFCMAIMVVVTDAQWTPMWNQILRLDLWYKHWGKINDVGIYIIKQSADLAPFIKVLNDLIVTNYNSGHLYLERGFPLDEISKKVTAEYN